MLDIDWVTLCDLWRMLMYTLPVKGRRMRSLRHPAWQSTTSKMAPQVVDPSDVYIYAPQSTFLPIA